MRDNFRYFYPNLHRSVHGNFHGSCGYSLIEVLVAIFILGIGVLGAAALQLNAMKYNQFADTRSQATFLAYEIADKMRANRDAARDGNYDIALSASNPTGSQGVVASDLQQWREDLSNRLPSGKGGISRGVNDVFTITVQWDESRLDKKGNASLNQFVFVTEL